MKELTDEIMASPALFERFIKQQIIEAFIISFIEYEKILDYEFLYGEGSYEEFIFGSAPGL